MNSRIQNQWRWAGACAALWSLGYSGCAGDVDVDVDAESAEGVAAHPAALSLVERIPPELSVPSGHRVSAYRYGVGVQIYTCAATGTRYSWGFVAPSADLYFPRKRPSGSHYAGPTWEAIDGSTVVGVKVASVTVDAAAVPWLLLQASSHGGDGAFSNVSYIQRLRTAGGVTPSSDCGSSNVGETVEVDYTADYVFYEPCEPAISAHL